MSNNEEIHHEEKFGQKEVNGEEERRGQMHEHEQLKTDSQEQVERKSENQASEESRSESQASEDSRAESQASEDSKTESQAPEGSRAESQAPEGSRAESQAPEDTKTENQESENTKTENQESENTKTENRESEDTKTENQASEESKIEEREHDVAKCEEREHNDTKAESEDPKDYDQMEEECQLIVDSQSSADRDVEDRTREDPELTLPSIEDVVEILDISGENEDRNEHNRMIVPQGAFGMAREWVRTTFLTLLSGGGCVALGVAIIFRIPPGVQSFHPIYVYSSMFFLFAVGCFAYAFYKLYLLCSFRIRERRQSGGRN